MAKNNEPSKRKRSSQRREIITIHPDIQRSAAYVRFLRDQQGQEGEHPLNSSTPKVGPDRSKEFLGRPPIFCSKNQDERG